MKSVELGKASAGRGSRVCPSEISTKIRNYYKLACRVKEGLVWVRTILAVCNWPGSRETVQKTTRSMRADKASSKIKSKGIDSAPRAILCWLDTSRCSYGKAL